MGAKNEKPRVVLDTNVILSAVLFKGETSALRILWTEGRIMPFLSRETFYELHRALRYPKFKLGKPERDLIVSTQVLPFFEIIEIVEYVSGICRDPDDDIFLSCALAAQAGYLVTGDNDLLSIGEYGFFRIITPKVLLRIFA